MTRTWCVALVGLLFALAACGEEEKQAKKPAKPAKRAAPSAERPMKTKPADQPPPPPKPDPALVERGQYLADVVGGCAVCHFARNPDMSPDMSKPYAGGMELPEAIGVIHMPNISQDKKTGIGGWTDEQIIAAIREGKRPDGTQLYPFMPYPFYNAMSNDDAKAMVAYLRTVPAVDNAVPGNTDLKMPKIPAPAPKGEAPPAGDPVKQGEYLFTLMHCTQCHTPMTEQGPDMAKANAGGMEFPALPMLGTGSTFSPNITSDKKTGLGDWTDEQIAAAITQGKRKDGSPIGPPMMFYTMGPWSRLKPDDVNALVAYIKTIPPIENQVAKSTFKPKGPPPAGGGGGGKEP